MYDIIDFSLISGFLLGLIGSSFGAWLAYLFAGRKRRKEEFQKAAISFRNAFLPEYFYLKYDTRIDGAESSDDLCEFLRAGYIKRHLKEFETFRRHLKSGKRKKFEKAWREYCHYDVEGDPDRPFFEMYHGDLWEGQSTRNLALKYITQLMSFAE